jgi:hypothetical protein
LSAHGGPVQENKQPAGLATTPCKANIAGAPRLSCVNKFANSGLEEKHPYLFDNRSPHPDSTLLAEKLLRSMVPTLFPHFLVEKGGIPVT